MRIKVLGLKRKWDDILFNGILNVKPFPLQSFFLVSCATTGISLIVSKSQAMFFFPSFTCVK